MNIGEAARRAGVSAKMIRHYEQNGLLRPAARTEAGYRQYDRHSVEELKFIRQARVLGFSIRQIEDLLRLRRDPHRASRAVRTLAEQHLAEVEEKMRELAAMKTTLEQLIAACPGDEHPDCAILERLSAPANEQP
ncbi:Cu(I)-responsive transcriptional regulator [Zobellella denitrificans]|jgi:Cu(I)-responsive transcriptional regulator|uniref:Cu(I)-responsive transcriptional regulator n=1 Tax=Zobellella denitrificans TaxID=347534 RepID=UPI000B8C3E71|nr:Cu(I)-responsive transcriptional regulator [Zobellella denitrificans]OXS14370.1 Cu(I)-responsive transcriptional regulator [Zobellella denitrificans]